MKIKNLKLKILLVLFLIIFNFSFANLSFATDLDIYSPSVILIERKTGKILYEKNSHEKMYPASLTKIMTAILTLENCQLTDIAKVSYNALMSIPSGYSHANLQLAEELTIDQLLHLILIPSANDAAVVLAEHIGGSVEGFSTMMNTKAKELGCTNTNFLNPNGIHNDNHYSTASDFALISNYAMNNEIFRKIITTTSYTLSSTNKYTSNDRVFVHTNLSIRKNTRNSLSNYYYSKAIGIKTGFTSKAQNCISSCATDGDVEYITVILGAKKNASGLDTRYLDLKNLFNYAFNTYSYRDLKDANSYLKTINIKNATRKTKNLDLLVKDSISALIKTENIEEILIPEIILKENLQAPIKSGEKVGTLKYQLEDITYTSDIIAGKDVEKSNLFITFLIIFLLLIIVLFIWKLIRYNIRKKRKALLRRNFR